jgi:hypothetical protein
VRVWTDVGTRNLRSSTSLAPRKTASDGHVPPLPPIFAIDGPARPLRELE